MNPFAIIGLVGIVALAAWICLPFLSAFVWALVVYRVGIPLQKRLLQRFSPCKTALIMLLIVILTIVFPIVLIGTQLRLEATAAYQKLMELGLFNLTTDSVRAMIEKLPLPDLLREHLLDYDLDAVVATHASDVGRRLLSLSSTLLTRVAMNTGSYIFSIFAFLFIYYNACVDGALWSRRLLEVLPASWRVDTLLDRLAAGAASLFWSVAGSCVAQGISAGIIFVILGLPAPLLVATLVTFFALIPFIGTAMIWGPFVLWLLLTGATFKAIVLAVYGTFIIGSLDNVTRPLLARRCGGELSAFNVTIGALGGLATFGLTGLVIGPLAIEAFAWLFERLAESRSQNELSRMEKQGI